MRFYEQNEGKIKIDNFDISKIDLYSLRNQIGIVLKTVYYSTGQSSQIFR